LDNSIVFLGTEWSKTSRESLFRLIAADLNIAAIITLKNRNILISFYRNIILNIINKNEKNLRQMAKDNQIPYIEIIDINSMISSKHIKKYNPDLIIVCIFGQILKKKILEIPRLGTINMHPSLLPEYKGPDPYFWVMKNVEKETGVTIHYIDEGVDTGDIILQERYIISEGLDMVEMKQALSIIGSNLLVEAVKKIFEGKNIGKKQNKNGSKFPSPNKSDFVVDCGKDVKYIYNFIKSIKSIGPILRIGNKEFRIKDAIKYEQCHHNKFPDFKINNRKLLFHAKDGVILLETESSADKILRYFGIFKIFHLIQKKSFP